MRDYWGNEGCGTQRRAKSKGDMPSHLVKSSHQGLQVVHKRSNRTRAATAHHLQLLQCLQSVCQSGPGLQVRFAVITKHMVHAWVRKKPQAFVLVQGPMLVIISMLLQIEARSGALLLARFVWCMYARTGRKEAVDDLCFLLGPQQGPRAHLQTPQMYYMLPRNRYSPFLSSSFLSCGNGLSKSLLVSTAE